MSESGRVVVVVVEVVVVEVVVVEVVVVVELVELPKVVKLTEDVLLLPAASYA